MCVCFVWNTVWFYGYEYQKPAFSARALYCRHDQCLSFHLSVLILWLIGENCWRLQKMTPTHPPTSSSVALKRNSIQAEVKHKQPCTILYFRVLFWFLFFPSFYPFLCLSPPSQPSSYIHCSSSFLFHVPPSFHGFTFSLSLSISCLTCFIFHCFCCQKLMTNSSPLLLAHTHTRTQTHILVI